MKEEGSSEMKKEGVMAMKIRVVKDVLKRGVINTSRNRMMGIASIGSVAATLLILGMILIVILNINNMASGTQKQFDRVQAYIEKGTDDATINNIQEEIEKINGVKKVKFFSKEDGLKEMREQLGDKKSVLDGLEEDNPLPDSFIVEIKDLEKANGVVKELRKVEGIKSVTYYKDTVDKLMRAVNVIRTSGLVIIGILILISVFIISNTIKITVAAREKEIGIMKYVGATNGFIRGPFIVEGVLLGIIGSIVAIVVVFSAYNYLFGTVADWNYNVLYSNIISPSDIIVDLVMIFVSIGVGIGTLGSILSLRKYLNV